MTQAQLKDLLDRALWTALQAGLVAWSLVGYQTDKIALGAVMGAALSAVKTYLLMYMSSRI